MNEHDHVLIVATYWASLASLLILAEVHLVLPLLRAGARHRERVLAKYRVVKSDIAAKES